VNGVVLQVNVSKGGIPKTAIPSAEVTERGSTATPGDSRFTAAGARRFC
jgi:hypothetical protein